MSKFCALLSTACLIVIALGTPIDNGENVGTVDHVGKRTIVTGQKIYPYMVHIKIFERRGTKRNTYICGGVIIGKKTVLTAAHCVLDKNKPKVHIHAGVVDLKLEENKGQKIKVVNMLAHEDYRRTCLKNDGNCCLAVNDITILWLEKEFDFGPTVQKAKLSSKLEKPVYQQGRILGWGVNAFGVPSAMLQRGLVKVTSNKECDDLNSKFLITDNIICLSAVSGATRANSGDSGGPLVINKVVYGLSSLTAITQSCNKPVDIFTFIPAYSEWIKNSLRNGPPKKESSSCIIC